MRILSYNVNGIRAAISKGLQDYLLQEQFDIICFQETKAQDHQVNHSLLKEAGYHDYWHSAEKKGYSGVAIFCKQKPKHVEYGCGIKKYDDEGRIIRVDYDSFSVLSCYFPSGTSGDHRQSFKMEFLNEFFDYVKKLEKKHPKLIICGDYNICHRAIDIHDPIRNKDVSGFKPEEREWMEKWFESGYVDSFRYKHPTAVHRYSWWSLRANSRANNKGWRIDYISVSESLRGKIKDADIFPLVKHSDHCPVYLELSN